MSDEINALPLRAIEMPAEISRIEGCNCGGHTWHKTDCTIFKLSIEQAEAATAAADARMREFTAGLNAQLRVAGL